MNLVYLDYYLTILNNAAEGKKVGDSGLVTTTFARHAAPLVDAGLMIRPTRQSRYELTENGKEALRMMREISNCYGDLIRRFVPNNA